MGINHITISGNLTRNPDVKTTTSEYTILTFTVAVNDRKKNQETGEWEDVASFVDCKMFGKRAAYFADKLEKGAPVVVDGRIEQNKWVGRDGTNKSKIEVIANEIVVMRRDVPAQPQITAQQAYDIMTGNSAQVYENDASIPF